MVDLQLRLVVQTVALYAAGEIDQRFFLVQRPEHFDRCFERGQLAVGVENVELGIVLLERGAGVGCAVVLVVDFESLAFSDDQASNVLGQKIAIVGEIFHHLDVA